MLTSDGPSDKEKTGMTLDESIDTFAMGPTEVREVVKGITDAELDRQPADGTWTLRQNIWHLTHSDAIGIDRMLRIAFEKTPPLLIGYDETSGTHALFSDGHPTEELLTLFELNRKAFIRVAKRLPREAFDKYGIHNEAGKVTLGEMVEKYVKHVQHHLTVMRKKRGG
jgi:hypothetical protein